MKRKDLVCIFTVIIVFLPFFIFPAVYEFYNKANKDHAYILSFIKFGILATFGEMLGLRIRSGNYYKEGFGIAPRVIVWGFIGLLINLNFVIFGAGGPMVLNSLGMSVSPDILNQGFCFDKLLTAFTISVTLNIFFAPVFMTFHKITDEHIINTKGSLLGFFTPIQFGQTLSTLNWKVMWNFVFRKTIIFFWIPAHTISFLIPADSRVLFAAFLGIVLGVFLAIASLKSKES